MVWQSIEHGLIFFPEPYPNGFWNPQQFGVTVEDSFFETADQEKLHGWFALSHTPSERVILWFHGNAGNLSHRIDHLKKMIDFLPANLLIIDYRGYGKSSGKPSEPGLYQDALAAYQFLTEKKGYAPKQIILYGQSLGGAVAIDLAMQKDCAGVIVESSFTSIVDMAKITLPWLPVHLMVQTKMDSLSKISQIKTPLLFIHGDQDQIIPMEQGKKLFDAAKAQKEFYKVQKADHNDVYLIGGKDYFEKIKQFIEQVALPN